MVAKNKSFSVSASENDTSASKQYVYYITFTALNPSDADQRRYERKIKNFLERLDGEV